MAEENNSPKLEYIKEEEEIQAADKVKKLRAKLKKCRKNKEEYLDGWQRQKADFINYTKEESKRLEEFKKYANESLLMEIIYILDYFEIAIKELKDDDKNKEWFKGILSVNKNIKKILENNGISEINIAVGDKFNPVLCESLDSIKSQEEPETILEIFQKGYKLHDRVIRPARVRVAM